MIRFIQLETTRKTFENADINHVDTYKRRKKLVGETVDAFSSARGRDPPI